MLPFLKNKQVKDAGVMTQMRAPDESKPEDKELSGLEIAMEDFCNAHEHKDYKAMAKAFQAAFDLLELAPHDEIEHDQE